MPFVDDFRCVLFLDSTKTMAGKLECVFLEQGFRRVQTHSPRRTVIMDLTPSMDRIRDNLHVKWRAHLKRASKKGQHVIWGQNDELFALFKIVYMGMRERKGFVSFTDFEAFRKLQRHLPAREKLLVVLCGTGSEYYSGAIVSALGEVGLYLFGAEHVWNVCGQARSRVHAALSWKVAHYLEQQPRLSRLAGRLHPVNSLGSTNSVTSN